ncbi:MAG: elongation factor 1-beta [Candidatus Woesearchaeota archaeon]|jgi:elongation factor 1-beta
MPQIIIDMKVMPTSPDVDLTKLTKEIDTIITHYGGKLHKHEIQPIAFGLKALLLILTVDESKGSTDALEEKISKTKGVESVQVTGVSRALG